MLILASTITGFSSYIIHDKFVSLNNVLRGYNEMKKQTKKSKNFCGIHYINMVDISRKTYERNCTETIVDNEILCFNEKHAEEEWDHKILQEIPIKYPSDCKKQIWTSRRAKKQYNIIFTDEN